MQRLTGKSAIVTGAGSGIGRGIAIHFAQEGARVAVVDMKDHGRETVEQIRHAGGEAMFYQTDLRDEDQVREMVKAAHDRWSRLHILVNNAGVTGTTNVVTAKEEHWDTVMSTNLKGAWHCCKHAIPLMVKDGGGSIINISSTHVFRTQHNHFPYHAAKSGLHTMTLGICVDFGSRGIRANNICPGFIMTPMAEQHLQAFTNRIEKEKEMLASHPIGRFGTPEDVARAALFLASDEADFITGATLVVDGGRSAYQKAD